MSAMSSPTRGSTVAAAAATRDAGVRRVKRATRWLLTGSVALTGAFAGLAAQATSATNSAKAKAKAAAAAAQSSQVQSDPNAGDPAQQEQYTAPQAPSQAPQATQSAPSVSSGAS
jgi:hypothetical protein